MVDLDTRLLRAFVVVAEELNFTRASERLFIAQQALSSRSSSSRGVCGIEMTHDAESEPHRCWRAATALCHRDAWCLRRGLGTARVGSARRACAADGGTVWHRGGASGQRDDAPVRPTSSQRRVEGLKRRPNQPAAGLKEGTVDVAFVRPPFLDEGISMVTVLTEERYAVVSENHPLASREYVRPGDLVQRAVDLGRGRRPESARVLVVGGLSWRGAAAHGRADQLV